MNSENQSPSIETAGGPIGGYLAKVKSILFAPQEFFSGLPIQESLGSVLAFALITHWIGSALAFLIGMGVGVDKAAEKLVALLTQGNAAAMQQLRDNADLSRWMTWFQGVGSIVLDPFFVLISILFSTVILFIFSKILIAETDENSQPRLLSFENCMRIVSYAMTAQLFRVIPFVGGVIAWVYGIVLTIVGVSALFRVTSGRATAVVLLPKLVLGALFFAVIFGIIFLVVGMFLTAAK